MENIFFGIIILVAAVLLVAMFLLFFGPSRKKTFEPSEEDDELIMDPVTGKMVTVDELVAEHQVTVVTEDDARRIHEQLSEDTRSVVSPALVYKIMEGYYQGKALHDESEGPFDNEQAAIIVSEGFRMKSTEVTAEQVMEVFVHLK